MQNSATDQLDDCVYYRGEEYGELPQISRLMETVFDEFIAPGYDPHGTREFLGYIHPAAIAYRIKRNHFLRVATVEETVNERTTTKIVGVIEVRNHCHFSLLFVAGQFQRRGIASELVRQAIALCQTHNPTLQHVTVHADPRAVPAYEAMGFYATGTARIENGIHYIPMVYSLEGDGEMGR
jgi:GNAT superfamily N-acetyltransferase